MCGRFSLTVNEAELNEHFHLYGGSEPYISRYNCAPTQTLAVITQAGSNRLNYMRWGLIPSWAKDMKMGARMINARAETVLEKTSFRSAFLHRRCLVPATSFFEWKQDKNKTPYVIRLAGGGVFSMAGIWEEWKAADGSLVKSFAILTTQASSLVQPLHERMPVILSRTNESLWLSDLSSEVLSGSSFFLPEVSLEIYPVSNLVNSPKNELPEILLPVGIN